MTQMDTQKSVYDRCPSDTIYEQYMNGLIDIEWDADGNFVRTIPIEEECSYFDWF